MPLLAHFVKSLGPCDEMDLSPDSGMYAVACPFCRKRFILTFVFNTHLRAHVNYYHRFSGDDNTYRHQPFVCIKCGFQRDDIVEVTTHLEFVHSARYRVEPRMERQILAENHREQSRIIFLLSRKDNLADPLYINERGCYMIGTLQ